MPEREADERPIIITALKVGQTANDAPATVTVILPGTLSRSTTLPNSGTLAREVTGLSVTGVGEGLNRLFLRGVGDSPFNGFGQDSVAILFDEARLTYDAPDPGLSLLDIARVEILEGPQGPLYGTGALGGIVKIVPNAPDPSKIAGAIDVGLSTVADGDIGGDLSAMINLPISGGVGAVRAVVYTQAQPGWIDNADGRSDINRSRMRGGRIAVLWKPDRDWSFTLAAAFQGSNAPDSQYVDGGLGPLERPARMAERRDTDSQLLSATVRGKIGAIDLTSVTALSRFEVAADYDATPLAATLGTIGATRARDDRAYSVLDQEVRLEAGVDDRWKWLAGASFLHASTSARVTLRDTVGERDQLTLDRSVTEAALFGEARYTFSSRLSAGLGFRAFYSVVDDEGGETKAPTGDRRRTVRLVPSATIGWKPAEKTNLYVRAASGYRPGGIGFDPDTANQKFRGDRIDTLEVGAKHGGTASGLTITAFVSRWLDVQADVLRSDGLVATRNIGNAGNFGIELSAHQMIGRTRLAASAIAQRSRLDGGNDSIDDRRLPVVPDLAIRASVEHPVALLGWEGNGSLGLRYDGATHLSFDPTLDRRIGQRWTLDSSLSLGRGPWTLAIEGDNLLNSHADSFGFGNPYRLTDQPQSTPLRPRSLSIRIGRRFP